MDELAKAIQKKYIEDLTSKYPIHRFFCLFIFLIASYSITNNSGLSFLNNIGELKITYLFNFSSGLLSEVNITYLTISLILLIVSKEIYSKIKDFSFKSLSKSSDFNQYIKEIEDVIIANKSSNESMNYYLSKDISNQLEKSRATIRSFHNLSEIIFCIFISIIWGFKYWSIIEVLTLIICMVIIIWYQWKSFNYYISNFLPYYITEKILLGGHAKFGEK